MKVRFAGYRLQVPDQFARLHLRFAACFIGIGGQPPMFPVPQKVMKNSQKNCEKGIAPGG